MIMLEHLLNSSLFSNYEFFSVCLILITFCLYNSRGKKVKTHTSMLTCEKLNKLIDASLKIK